MTASTSAPAHPTVRSGAAPAPPDGIGPYHYADYFEGLGPYVQGPDRPTGRQVLDHGLAGLPTPLEDTVRSVLRHVLGFRLAPQGTPGHVLGWRVASEEPDRIVLAAEGWLARAHLVLSATEEGWYGVATYIRWKHRAGPVIWIPVRPVHRAVARYLVGAAVRP